MSNSQLRAVEAVTSYGRMLYLLGGIQILLGAFVMLWGYPGEPVVVGGRLYGMILIVLGSGCVATGAKLRSFHNRTLGIVVAIFLLFVFPVGTIIGLYGIWVLFSRDGNALFSDKFLIKELRRR